jgi:hypothetical protein
MTGTVTSNIAPSFQGHSVPGAVSGVGCPRLSFDICPRNPAKIVTIPAINKHAGHARSAARAALKAVNSLWNKLNGGTPVMANVAIKHNPPVHGSVWMTPVILRK